MNIRSHHVGTARKLSLGGLLNWRMPNRFGGLKDPDDLILVAVPKDESRGCIPFTLLTTFLWIPVTVL